MHWFSRKTSKVLTQTQRAMSRVVGILKGKKQLSQEELTQLRDALIDSDVGLALTDAAMEHIRTACAQGVTNDNALVDILKSSLVDLFQPGNIQMADELNVILVVGVNGVGKTTSIAKLAKYYMARGHKVALASGDTYRAAADEQLSHWAEQVGAIIVREIKPAACSRPTRLFHSFCCQI